MKLKQNTNLSEKKKDYVTPQIESVLVETEKGDCIFGTVSVKQANDNKQEGSKKQKDIDFYEDFID